MPLVPWRSLARWWHHGCCSLTVNKSWYIVWLKSKKKKHTWCSRCICVSSTIHYLVIVCAIAMIGCYDGSGSGVGIVAVVACGATLLRRRPCGSWTSRSGMKKRELRLWADLFVGKKEINKVTWRRTLNPLKKISFIQLWVAITVLVVLVVGL